MPLTLNHDDQLAHRDEANTFTQNQTLSGGSLNITTNYWDNTSGGTIVLENPASVGAALTFRPTASTSYSNGWSVYAGASGAAIGDGSFGFWDHDEFVANGSTNAARWYLDAQGSMNVTRQPACTIACQASDINWATGSLVGYGYSGSIKLLDTHNAFNMSTYTYTAPVKGNYYVGYTCNDVESSSGRMRAYLRVNGSNIGNAIHARGTTGLSADLDMRTIAIVIPLQANDTVNVYVGEGTVDTFGSNYFTIYKLG